MTKDCKCTIDQEEGDLKITFDVNQCGTCPETDCDGKGAATISDGPSETEPTPDKQPGKVYEGPFNAKAQPEPSPDDLYNALLSQDPANIPPDVAQAINAFGTLSLQTLTEIMAGRATGFLIVATGPEAIKEWHYMDETVRIKTLAQLAMTDLEKKIKTLTPAGWLGSVLGDLLK